MTTDDGTAQNYLANNSSPKGDSTHKKKAHDIEITERGPIVPWWVTIHWFKDLLLTCSLAI